MSDDKYDRGYCKPPKEHQFKPGKSGNPGGRKKGSKNAKKAFRDFMEERLPGSQLNAREALIKTLLQQALVEKKLQALKILLDRDAKYSPEIYQHGSVEILMKKIEQLERELEEEKAKPRGGVLVVPAGVPLDEYLIECEKQRQIMLKHQAEYE